MVKMNSPEDTEENSLQDVQLGDLDGDCSMFARRSGEGTSGMIGDLVDALSSRKVSRTSALSRIQLNPDNHELVLVSDKTNIRSRYGYDVGKVCCLYPEEALYLLECGKAEIYCNHVTLSIQRARSLLLVPQRKESKITQATHDEYLVYKCLSKMGYCLYRYKEATEDVGSMDTDDDVILDEPVLESEAVELSNERSALKRKYPEEDDEEMEESGEFYTVDEADSDVEIVDEVIFAHRGVEIQEIGDGEGFDFEMGDEPVPSTSRATSNVLVDLVSSEDESEDSTEYATTIWSKFTPNSTLKFRIPPSKLIPESIPQCDKQYEFDLKDKTDISDLELEYLVDEVSLSDDKLNDVINLCNVKTWKEWRQNMFQEARVVLNNSLLGCSEFVNGEVVSEKLCLWGDERGGGVHFGKIVFEMYEVGYGWSRQKGCGGGVSYYVMISRQDEAVPDFGLFGSSLNGVPILIAVICDSGENDVLFMTADRSPLNSLF